MRSEPAVLSGSDAARAARDLYRKLRAGIGGRARWRGEERLPSGVSVDDVLAASRGHLIDDAGIIRANAPQPANSIPVRREVDGRLGGARNNLSERHA